MKNADPRHHSTEALRHLKTLLRYFEARVSAADDALGACLEDEHATDDERTQRDQEYEDLDQEHEDLADTIDTIRRLVGPYLSA